MSVKKLKWKKQMRFYKEHGFDCPDYISSCGRFLIRRGDFYGCYDDQYGWDLYDKTVLDFTNLDASLDNDKWGDGVGFSSRVFKLKELAESFVA
jgi:hypothetical protein